MPDPIELLLPANGQRLDQALAEIHPALSRTQWQALIKDGGVIISGQKAKRSMRLDKETAVTAHIPEVKVTELLPEAIPLDIIYEDDDILLINKPAGMVVHPAPGHQSGTLVNAVLAHCPGILQVGGEERPGVVHRLDKDTSGLILVAKNDHALRYMQEQFKERTIFKKYIALCEGVVNPPTGLIDAPIGRDPKQRKRMTVIRKGSATSRPSKTEYKTLTNYDDYTLVACYPLTGRTHQIRVHMAFLRHPLVGDAIYGRQKQRIPLNRHFLHAAELRFKRPSDDELMTFTSPLPPALQQVIDTLSG